MPRQYNDPMIYSMYEGISRDDYVIATYLIASGMRSDIIIKAAAVAVEQSTGSWAYVPGETKEVRKRSIAKVIGIYGVPDYELIATLPDEERRNYVIKVAYPSINFYDNIPLMLSSVIGNISSMPFLKLVDLEFPKSFVKQFKGPKFGIQGIREILNLYGRPLLNNMIKPCTGLTPEEGAKLFYEVAVGGVDWVKDDELIAASPAFSPLEERVKKYMEAGRKADKKKGAKTLYTVNITDEVDRLLDNAERAIDAGVNALMINVFATGFSGLRMLAENPKIKVPIMAHSCFGGTSFAQHFSGVGSVVTAKLARLCGADLYLNVAPSAKFNALQEKFLWIQNILTTDFYHIKPTMGLLGGGVTPGMVPYLIDAAGIDTAIGLGAGVHAHPMGPRAGAIAMRQAIDAAIKNIPLEEAAKKQKELESALDKWGIYGTEAYNKLFDIET